MGGFLSAVLACIDAIPKLWSPEWLTARYRDDILIIIPDKLEPLNKFRKSTTSTYFMVQKLNLIKEISYNQLNFLEYSIGEDLGSDPENGKNFSEF